MTSNSHIRSQKGKRWELQGITISHNVLQYHQSDVLVARDDTEAVRMHFGLRGSYQYSAAEFETSYNLSGHHNNILYSDGLTLEVRNTSAEIETFGINIEPETFIRIGRQGNTPLQEMTSAVSKGQCVMLSPNWRSNDWNIQRVIQEILDCPHSESLRDLFLWSKVIELLVIQAELYGSTENPSFINSSEDRKKIIDARELVLANLEQPPCIPELAQAVGLNEYKLKKGFKEVFGTTIFGCIHNQRMLLAKRLLLGTTQSAKEIAYKAGYNSPQYFSRRFRKTFGVSPSSIRKTPDSAIE